MPSPVFHAAILIALGADEQKKAALDARIEEEAKARKLPLEVLQRAIYREILKRYETGRRMTVANAHGAYACPKCGVRFRQSDARNEHAKTCNGEG